MSSSYWSKHNYSIEQLKKVACEAYGLNSVKLAKTFGFPPMINAATADTSLAWDPRDLKNISDSPFNIHTDSMVIIVRDAEENCPKLSLNEREELKRKEAMRIQAIRQASEKFVRREKPITIKLD